MIYTEIEREKSFFYTPTIYKREKMYIFVFILLAFNPQIVCCCFIARENSGEVGVVAAEK